MPHELLAKPGTVTANSIVEGAISYDSSESNKLFIIKAATVQISSAVDVVEVTGADDTERIYEQGRFAATQFQIGGYMVGDSAVLISNLVHEDNDGNQNANCKLTFRPSSSRRIVGPVVFERIDIQWGRNSPYVAVSISGRFTKVDFVDPSEEA